MNTQKWIVGVACLFLAGPVLANEIYKQGIAAEASQDFEKAIELFNSSIEKEGEKPETYNHIGYNLSQLSSKYANDAYKEYKKALKLDPNHEESLSLLGELYIWQGNLLKANEILIQLKKLESAEADELDKKIKKIVMQAKKIQ